MINTSAQQTLKKSWNIAWRTIVIVGSLCVLSALVWQGIAVSGNPDPTAEGHLDPYSVILQSGLLVFREGLEVILVLSAITASMMGSNRSYQRPIAIGSGLALIATVATWFIVIAVISSVNARELDIQAATGLLAIVVLLVIMNWFFHKIYWTGWISFHNKRKRAIMSDVDKEGKQSRTVMGLALLGFTAMYREGFEVVLFLQNLRLQAGTTLVLQGVAIGLFFSAIIAVLTFIIHRRLPYKKMLILTGVMLAVVLVVMVGESIQEMQIANWISTTTVNLPIPEWMGLWFAIFPNLEGLISQGLAGVVVIGSYFLAQYIKVWRPRKAGSDPAQRAETPPSFEALAEEQEALAIQKAAAKV